MRPSQVALNGDKYLLHPERPYRKTVSTALVQRSAIIGASRFAQTPIPDVLEWTIDEFGRGEGFKFLDPSEGSNSQKGYYTSDPIDITVNGQVQPAKAVANSRSAAVAVTSGPYLAVSGGVLWLTYNTVSEYTTDGVTWTASTNGMGAQDMVGPPSPHSSGLFVGGVRSGADGGIRRLTTGGNTSWVAESGRSPLAADNRVYWFQRGATNSLRRYVGLDAAGAGTTATTFNGVGSTYDGAPLMMVAVGSTIYSLIGTATESARLWKHAGTEPGSELAVFHGLHVQSAEPGMQMMAVVNGVVFVAGWNADANRAEVRYYDGENIGTLGVIRGNPDQTGISFVTCLAPGRENELLIGVSYNSSTQAPQLFRYNMLTGGLSLVAEATAAATNIRLTSAAYYKGRYWLAHYAGVTTLRVDASSATDYATDQEMTFPIWDFGLPAVEKILTEIEVHTAVLPSGASLEVTFGGDGAAATTTTTDSAGATMAHTSGARTKFTISDNDTERVFRYLQPRAVLKTSTATNATTAYSMTIRAIPAAVVRKYELHIQCLDNSPAARVPGEQITGRMARARLDTLIDDTTNRIWTFKPLFEDSAGPWPHPDATQVNVICEDAEYIATGQGEGVYRLLLRQL